MGYLDRSNKIIAEPLTRDHNACLEEVRKELKTLHPEDSQILVMKQGVWRVKGIIQVSNQLLMQECVFFFLFPFLRVMREFLRICL